MSVPIGAAAATAGTTAPGLPVVNQALEPAWVRNGSASTQKAYESALAFEQSLVEQLAKSLADTSGLSGESSQEGGESGGESSGAGSSQLSSMLPQALTSSVMDGGGLGMAAQMTRQLEGVQAPGAAKANGGTSAA
jgi:Rod binding domain-containing protein